MQVPDNVVPFPSRDGHPPEDEELDLREWMARFLDNVHGGGGDTSSRLGFIQGLAGRAAVTDDAFLPRRIRPKLLRAGRERVCFVVRLDLDGAAPPIWRRLRLASDLRLSQLHEIIQVAMGWTDSHLHHFQMGPDSKDFMMNPFLTQFDLDEGETEGRLEDEVRLDQVIAKPGHRVFYEYDFGDSWHHTIKLEKVEAWTDGDPVAACVTGRRACPPEDVGGLPGYAEVLDALAGRVEPGNAEWMAEKVEWMPPGFDPAAFDVAAVNELLRYVRPSLEAWNPEIARMLHRDWSRGESGLLALLQRALVEEADLDDDGVAAATSRYRVLLRTVGAGLELTAAGYLAPSVVAALCEELDLGPEWFGRGNRESQTLPVITLRQSATALGLVRKAKGRLHVTKAGQKLVDDPRALLDHVRARIPVGREFERDAGLLRLLQTAAELDGRSARVAAAELATALGWASDGDLATAVIYSAHPTMEVLDQMCGRLASGETRARLARALIRRP